MSIPSLIDIRGAQRRLAMATRIGTTVDSYDYFICTTAAGLVFAHLFLEPAGPQIGLLLSYVTAGVRAGSFPQLGDSLGSLLASRSHGTDDRRDRPG